MTTTLAWIDYLIMLIYLAFVLGIGFALMRMPGSRSRRR